MVATERRMSTLADLVDRILDKGLVLNADITVSIVGVELLGIKLRAALASFETAARYGLQFPGGVCVPEPGWREAACGRDSWRPWEPREPWQPWEPGEPSLGSTDGVDAEECLWRLMPKT